MDSPKFDFIVNTAISFLEKELSIACLKASSELFGCKSINYGPLTVSIDIEDDVESTVNVSFEEGLIKAICMRYAHDFCSTFGVTILEESAMDVANIIVGNSMPMLCNNSQSSIHIGLPTVVRSDIWLCENHVTEHGIVKTEFGQLDIYLVYKNLSEDD